MEHARKGNYEVTIENVTDDMSCLSVAGPYSRDVLSKLTSTDMSNSGFKFLTIKDIDIAGLPVLAMRISYTGKLRSFIVFFGGGGGGGWGGGLTVPFVIFAFQGQLKSEGKITCAARNNSPCLLRQNVTLSLTTSLKCGVIQRKQTYKCHTEI